MGTPLDPHEEVALRVTEYDVASYIDGVKATVGWHGEWGSYWFHMVRESISDVAKNFAGVFVGEIYFQGGGPTYLDRITNLADLVDQTWNEIDWENAPGVIWRLRDDPMFEFIGHSIGVDTPVSFAVRDFLVAELDAPRPTPADDPAAKAAPAVLVPAASALTDDPAPAGEGRRGLFNRRRGS